LSMTKKEIDALLREVKSLVNEAKWRTKTAKMFFSWGCNS